MVSMESHTALCLSCGVVFWENKVGIEIRSGGDHLELNFDESKDNSKEYDPVIISSEANKVLTSGEKVWAYYAEKVNTFGGNHNASLYDIKEYFKGRDEKGRMNSKSEGEYFNSLMEDLRLAMQELCKAIVPKVYSYGFLI